MTTTEQQAEAEIEAEAALMAIAQVVRWEVRPCSGGGIYHGFVGDLRGYKIHRFHNKEWKPWVADYKDNDGVWQRVVVPGTKRYRQSNSLEFIQGACAHHCETGQW
jgi:hypothetical protein